MGATEDDDNRPADAELRWERDDEHEPRGPVEIAPGVKAFLPVRAAAHANGLTWVLDVDLNAGRLVCTRLEVESGVDGPGVSSELIRKFPVGRHVRRIIEADATVDDPNDLFAGLTSPRELLSSGPTDENLQYVARVYRIAELADANPTQAVEALGLERRTAQRWLRTAREKGLL